ncbi:MAG TPA: hypothetical protein VLA80_10575 [Actinomycetota bacterium]|nr:hypothetical protein [Actinomycetota bacterium]
MGPARGPHRRAGDADLDAAEAVKAYRAPWPFSGNAVEQELLAERVRGLADR